MVGVVWLTRWLMYSTGIRLIPQVTNGSQLPREQPPRQCLNGLWLCSAVVQQRRNVMEQRNYRQANYTSEPGQPVAQKHGSYES